jgi:hypothetical protein
MIGVSVYAIVIDRREIEVLAFHAFNRRRVIELLFSYRLIVPHFLTPAS